ncbi:hypothetical protein TSAR_015330 [Trichomalopsis sarcophagae]|uniref:Fibronectin type-III domain-containing protein n=1 Tax=Trichomalopsis sarcophagae TaxID=543379 RepID=A0A232EVZ2_9HYME|nr:hypothetical protein TSAR_015330 [Trichomalopsis sarcophagae]
MRWSSWPSLCVPVLWLLQVRASLLEDSLRLALCQARCPDDLKCIEECHSAGNNVTDIPYLQKSSESNIHLQCKDANRLVLKHRAGIYVIETLDSFYDNWTSPIISKNRFYESANLMPRHRYRYRIRKVTSQGVSLPEITEWFQTNAETYVPIEVKNLSISEINANKNRPGQLQARLDIIPADGKVPISLLSALVYHKTKFRKY